MIFFEHSDPKTASRLGAVGGEAEPFLSCEKSEGLESNSELLTEIFTVLHQTARPGGPSVLRAESRGAD